MFKLKEGSVLISVIIIIAVALSLVIVVYERTTSSYSSVVKQQYEYQKAIYSVTAVEALKSLFKYDNTRYDGQTDIWNAVPPIPIQDGFLTITITPVNAKFPINGLANANEEIRDRYADAFRTLLEEKELPIDIVDDTLSYLGTGYLNAALVDESSSPYGYRGGKLQSLAEAFYIPAIGVEFNKVAEFASMGDPNGKVNLNFASREVIVALIPELEPYVDAIITARDENDLEDVSDVYELMGGSSQDTYNTALNFFDVKSQYFYVKIEIIIQDDISYYHILFDKNGTNASIIKYIEGGSIEYF